MFNTIIFIIVGLSAGILSGLFGIGGGIIIIPSLIYFAGFTQIAAQGTSLAILLPPVGILAFLEYYKHGNANLKAGIIICIFLIIGSFFGARLAHSLSNQVLQKAFGILMFLISLKLIFGK